MRLREVKSSVQGHPANKHLGLKDIKDMPHPRQCINKTNKKKHMLLTHSPSLCDGEKFAPPFMKDCSGTHGIIPH